MTDKARELKLPTGLTPQGAAIWYWMQIDEEFNGEHVPTEDKQLLVDLIQTLITQAIQQALDAQAAEVVALQWQPIETAPKGEQFTALIDLGPMIDLWSGERRYADCCWSYSQQCWVRVVRYVTPKGIRKTVYNKVKDPTHWMPIPALTQPSPRATQIMAVVQAAKEHERVWGKERPLAQETPCRCGVCKSVKVMKGGVD
jgi:hypothetical protein